MRNIFLAFITIGLASCEVNIQGLDTQALENLDSQDLALSDTNATNSLNEDSLQEDDNLKPEVNFIDFNNDEECFHTLRVEKSKQEKIDKQFLQAFRKMSEKEKEKTRLAIANILQEIEPMDEEEAYAFLNTLEKPLPSCSLYFEIFDLPVFNFSE